MMEARVDAFLDKIENWRQETEKLRKVLLSCGLDEALKWGKPTYTYEGKNIAVIQGFKEYFALLFINGYLLSDPEGILVKMGENTVVGRQLRFSNVKEIIKMAPVIKAYIYEAIEMERSGIKLPKEKREVPLPAELQKALKENIALKTAFKALTPGRQKAYIFYFSQAKQSKTREARIEKCIPKILQGKGLDDYK
ncbi:MAG TPA: YdeI/OmpD-associated family protein [Flavipsychrobacter sp.]|nr:YdeI/OmpD-associated family protein [Flavipsychrobacter sp.]